MHVDSSQPNLGLQHRVIVMQIWTLRCFRTGDKIKCVKLQSSESFFLKSPPPPNTHQHTHSPPFPIKCGKCASTRLHQPQTALAGIRSVNALDAASPHRAVQCGAVSGRREGGLTRKASSFIKASAHRWAVGWT